MDNLFLIVFGVVIGGLIAALIIFIRRLYITKSRLERLMEDYQNQTNQNSKNKERMSSISRIIYHYSKATKESDILEIFLQTLLDLSGAVGASYVPLDERDLPKNAIIRGDLPHPAMDAWAEYIASPSVRENCGLCEQYNQVVRECPLLDRQFSENNRLWEKGNVYCLPISIKDYKLGVLNLYLEKNTVIDRELNIFINTLTTETAIVIQAMRFKTHGDFFTTEFQNTQGTNDIIWMMSSLLEIMRSVLTAEFVILNICDYALHFPGRQFVSGIIPEDMKSLIDNFIPGVENSKKTIIYSDIYDGPSNQSKIKSFIGIPVRTLFERDFGVIIAGIKDLPEFSDLNISRLKAFTEQFGAIFTKIEDLSLLEYRSVMQERGRIAREIHDGLAQTLGLLKLQAAQIKGFLYDGDSDRARRMMDEYYQTLSDAFDDTREAIDNLRADIADRDIDRWMLEFGSEFRNISGLQIHVDCEKLPFVLPPEINSQLIRIVQESLSNIRKHAQAKNVWLSTDYKKNYLIIEIRDDGVGFIPDDVRSASRYGLRGMKERAELIGADFQIISNQENGTSIQIQLAVLPVVEERN